MLLALLVLAPLATAALLLWRQERQGWATIGIVGALANAILTLATMAPVLAGARPTLRVADFGAGLSLTLGAEPLGALFACLAATLWFVVAIYAVGYLRATGDKHPGRFGAFFAIAIACAQGVALSDNLLTLFVFYEILTLSTWPLVAHKGSAKAIRGGRVYMGFLMASSLGLLLPALVWTHSIAGSLDFTLGGLAPLRGLSSGAAVALTLLFAFGIGKMALAPLHRWLPAAMVAPAPVSALLHAVAVVKAGVFTMLKVGAHILGFDLLQFSGAGALLAMLAGVSIIFASFAALAQHNLKARLAYSTVAHLGYVALGVGLAHPLATAAAMTHIVAHGLGKVALFMNAGALETVGAKGTIDDFPGLARAMPYTSLAFVAASASVAGLPPGMGMWSKLWLAESAALVGAYFALAALAISAVLNAAYLVPLGLNALFARRTHADAPRREAPLACVIAPGAAALASILAFAFAPWFLAMALRGVSP